MLLYYFEPASTYVGSFHVSGGVGANEKNQNSVARSGGSVLCRSGLLLAANLSAQGIYATLTGVVSDPSQAVVAKAKVTLKDAQSGSQRETVTNNEGYFTFASVPVGTYELTVEAKGFNLYKVTGIALGGGEKRNVDVALAGRHHPQTVEITGAADRSPRSTPARNRPP